MPKKKNGVGPREVNTEEVKPVVVAPVISEKERLQILRKQLSDLRVNSVSDLDNLIAKAE